MENSLSQYGSEGVYQQIDDVLCSVRPVYEQIWPNFKDVQYMFFPWASNAWVIGESYENCNAIDEVFERIFVVCSPLIKLIICGARLRLPRNFLMKNN